MATVQGQYKGQTIYAGSDADVAKQMAAIDSGTTQTAQLGTQAYSQQLLQQSQALLQPKPISATQTPVQPMNVPPAPPPPAPPPVDPVIQALQAQQQQAQAAIEAGNKEQGTILQSVESLLNQQGQMGARQSQLEQEQGLPDKLKQLEDINAQIRQTVGQAFSDQQMAEGRLAPTFAISGDQQRIEREKAVRTFGLSAAGALIQGQIGLAMDHVKRAIDSEFSGIESRLKYQQVLLDLNRDKLTGAQRDKADAIQQLLQERKEQVAQQKADRETIQGLALQAQQGGAPSAVISAMMTAKDFGTALSLAGEYLQPQTVASIQEYNFAVKNGYKGSYVQYQNEDANRKASIARAGVGTTGLTTQQYGALNSITTKFQADPIINQAVKGQTAASIADQIIANPNSATQQLKALYVLVKNLDPDSAVREGELALANQTQSYLQQFGNSLARINDGRVIAPEAAKALAVATKELLTAWNTTAKKREKQYTSQANTLGIGDAFGSYIGGSDLGYNAVSQTNSTSQLKPGDTVAPQGPMGPIFKVNADGTATRIK